MLLSLSCSDADKETKQNPPEDQSGKSFNFENYQADILAKREKLDSLFADTAQSPLTLEALKNFDSLQYFPVQKKYRVKARFNRTPESRAFGMPTTTDRLPVYEKYGEARFNLEGRDLVLNIYQNYELRDNPDYENYLFLPFGDKTNGEDSYSGGRYLDLKIPESDSLIIDFNKAYNPYCAYNEKYSCPLIPKENILDIKIEAGVKKIHK